MHIEVRFKIFGIFETQYGLVIDFWLSQLRNLCETVDISIQQNKKIILLDIHWSCQERLIVLFLQ